MLKTWRIRRKESVDSRSFHQYNSSGSLSFLGQFFHPQSSSGFYSHLFTPHLIPINSPTYFKLQTQLGISTHVVFSCILVFDSLTHLPKHFSWLIALQYIHLSKIEIILSSPSLPFSPYLVNQ